MTIGMIVLVILGVLVLGFSIGAIIYGFICDEVETGVSIFAAGLIIGFFLRNSGKNSPSFMWGMNCHFTV